MLRTQRGFWEQVDKAGDCWIWTGRLDPDGYGKYRFRLKEIRAHRWAYEEAFGPLGALFACHRCDNPPCVRPDHLFAGTGLDNTRDMIAKGRRHPTRPPIAKPKKVTPQIEARVLLLRQLGSTQVEIGRDVGLSQAYVSKLLRRLT